MLKLLHVTSRGDQQFLVRANHRIRHSESDQFPFQWKGTWTRFHLCWSLQGRRASPITEVHQAFTIHVAVGGHFSGTQRCLHCYLYKRKGNRQLCDNHQGILLPVITGKIFARVLLNRFFQCLEDSHLSVHMCALNAATKTVMQLSIDWFSTACDNFGLSISTKKIGILYQPVL